MSFTNIMYFVCGIVFTLTVELGIIHKWFKRFLKKISYEELFSVSCIRVVYRFFLRL